MCSLWSLQYSPRVPTEEGVVEGKDRGEAIKAGVGICGLVFWEVMGGGNFDAEGRNVLDAQSPS